MIKGLFFVLFFYFLGEAISTFIGGYIPGSVVGMILLFISLSLKIVKPHYVRDTAVVITKNMAVFFVPAAVGLIVYSGLLWRFAWAIAISIAVSTVLTIITVALVQERMEKRKKAETVGDE